MIYDSYYYNLENENLNDVKKKIENFSCSNV